MFVSLNLLLRVKKETGSGIYPGVPYPNDLTPAGQPSRPKWTNRWVSYPSYIRIGLRP